MIFRTHQKSVSLFKRTFALIVACVLFSLLNSGLLLMMFFGRFWKENCLTALTEDAVALGQNIEMLITDGGTIDDLANKDAFMMLSSSILSISKSSSCDIFLVDSEGSILLCKDVIKINGTNVEFYDHCTYHGALRFPNSIVNGMLACDETDDVFKYDGFVDKFGNEEFFLVTSGVKEEGQLVCHVLIMQLKSEAFKPYTAEFSSMMIISAGIAVSLAFVAAIGVSYRIIRPLKKVSEATHHYATGDFSVRISEKDNFTEIKELVSSVNSMAENLALIEESRSSFITNISHELKTPMTVISGFVDGMLDGTIEEADRDKYLNIISEEIKRLSRLVVSMLNMSKIEAGQLTLNYAEVELSAVILKTFMPFEKVITDKNISVYGLDNLQRTAVMADGPLIYQIIYNLVDNAIKFTPDGRSIFVSLTSEKKHAVIKIKNTGKGISDADKGLIFDRFYKADKSRRLDSTSFGIGLYIVKSIVELHNGTICINSEGDEYTEFVVELPM